MNSHETYLKNAQEVIEAAKRGQGVNRIDKPCSNCKYSYKDFVKRESCNHPTVILAASQVDPMKSKYIKLTSEQRSNSSWCGKVVCGPNAVLFEEKEKSWWRILFGI